MTSTSQPRHIVVIGAGLAGLAASYDLVRRGHRVTMLETSRENGGLASSIQIDGHQVERFYHFICRSDQSYINLINELDLNDQLHWQPTRTAFYYDGNHYRFGRPVDLLRFSPVPFFQRVRFGFHILRSYYRKNWKWLDALPAKAWLIENIGEEAYNVIWHPLLRVKFGEYHDQISAAWMWHRIWRVAQSRTSLISRETFGYLENGSATIINKLVDWLSNTPKATLRTGMRVDAIITEGEKIVAVRAGDETISCDAVLSTIALPVLNHLIPGQNRAIFKYTQQVQFIGVVCMLLSLKYPFSQNFWLNINDPHISFNGIIEQTNLNLDLRAAGRNILYVPFYLPTNDPRYNASPDELFREYLPMLKQINPAFDKSWIKEWHLFRTPYAQAVCVTNFLDFIPNHRTPIQGLYLTDSTQFYPEDRTLSAAIQQGRAVVETIQDDLR